MWTIRQICWFTDKVGNVLIFTIFTNNTKKIIFRSEDRTSKEPKFNNLQYNDEGDVGTDECENNGIIKSCNEESPEPPISFINVENLVGKGFSIP